MSVETIKEILVMIAPSISAILTILGGIIYIVRNSKKSTSKTLEKATEVVDSVSSKQAKEAKDIALIKTKIESIEQYLLKEKEKK